MKKTPAIVVISGLLVFLALRLFGGHPSATTNGIRLAVTCGYVALGILSLITATALWRGRSNALVWFGVWAAGYLALGGAVQMLTERASVGEVVIWWTFIGAVLLAVGAHLRYVRRQAVSLGPQ